MAEYRGADPGDEALTVTRVFVLAAHLVVRAGLKSALSGTDDLLWVGEAGTEKDVLGVVHARTPHVVILDADSYNEDSVSLVGRLVAEAMVSVLILTGVRGAHYHQALVRSGARGLVLKDAPIEVLLKAIRRVHRGELWFERKLLASTLTMNPTGGATAEGRPARRGGGLTGREREIVELIAEGLRNEQIAERMGVAEKTVRNRLSAVFDKCGVNDRLALVVYAYQHGLIVSSLSAFILGMAAAPWFADFAALAAMY